MEQNENVENNGFENFEDQRKYNNVNRVLEEKANKWGGLAKKIMFIETIIASLGLILLWMLPSSPAKKIFISPIMMLVFICHIISLKYTVLAKNMMRTKIVKEMILLHIIVPISVLSIVVLMVGWLYIFWGLFLGFAPERTTFIEFILSFLN